MSCTPHRVAQVSLVRVISWSSHDERISSTLSPPFPSPSSYSHSSLTSCTSSCTSSTTLRAVATLRISPEKRWTLLTTPTSSQKDRQDRSFSGAANQPWSCSHSWQAQSRSVAVKMWFCGHHAWHCPYRMLRLAGLVLWYFPNQTCGRFGC